MRDRCVHCSVLLLFYSPHLKTIHDLSIMATLIISPEHGVDVHEHSKVCEMLTLAPGPVLASLQGHTPRAVPRPEHGEQVLRGHVTVTMIQRKEIRSNKTKYFRLRLTDEVISERPRRDLRD